MKIIKEGRKQKGWAKELKCTGSGNGNGGCGAILLVEENDIFKTYRHHYDGESDTFLTFKCPNCSVYTDIENAPSFLYQKAKNEPKESDR